MSATARRRALSLGPVGPWRALVTVDAIWPDRGRQTSLPHETLFEVAVEWTGPPAHGFPPADRPVHARDLVIVTSYDTAAAVAHAAERQLAKPRVADLRVLAGLYGQAAPV